MNNREIKINLKSTFQREDPSIFLGQKIILGSAKDGNLSCPRNTLLYSSLNPQFSYIKL
jgi:hypothetical protein